MSQMNGMDFLTGSILGQILASNHEQIRLFQAHNHELQAVRRSLDDLPSRIAAAMPQQRPLMERLGLTTRQLLMLMFALSAALAGVLEGKDLKAVILREIGIEASSGTQ